MNELIYQMSTAGHMLRYRLRNEATARILYGYLRRAEGEQYDIAVDDERFALGERTMPDRTEAYIESKLLIALTAQRLLKYGACIFHAVAFAWRGCAWLLTGPSGVGKSTQYRLWKTLWSDEVEMICGDMPVLTTESDGSIRVHPSAWNGKEQWSGQVSAPLGGIVCLEQAPENTIAPMTAAQSADRLLQQFICVPDTESEIRDYAALADRLFTNYPVWLMRNLGDEDSARLTKQTLEHELTEGSGK